MAVVAADFLVSGGGRLNPAWFETDVNTLLTKWVEQAGTGSDELVTARVYATAFTHLSDLMMTEAAMQRDRNKTTQFSSEQITYWQAQARRYQSEVDALTGVGGPHLSGWEGDKEHGRLR